MIQEDYPEQATMTPQLLGRAFSREMIIHRVPEQARRLADLIRALTFDHIPPRDSAPIDDLDELDTALIMTRRDRERAEDLLIDLKILRVVRGGGRWWYEPLPLPDHWPDRPASRKVKEGGISSRAPSFEEMQAARDAWMRLDRAGIETDQQELNLRMSAAQRYADGGQAEKAAIVNRNETARREERGLGENPPKLKLSAAVVAQLGGKSPTPDGGFSPGLQTPARTRVPDHEHEPCTSSVPQSMSTMLHEEHGRSVAEEEDRFAETDQFAGMTADEVAEFLDDEGRHFAEQLPAIFGPAGTKAFRLTWLKRFCDRWATCAYRAIGEVKQMKLSGTPFKKGPGEAANVYFTKYRYEAWKASRAAEAKRMAAVK